MAVPLILGAVQRAALAELRTRAAAAPIDMPGLLERLKTPEGKIAHRRHMTAQSVEIPADFLVTFSIETGHPIGTCRHMSMSVGRKGRRPHPMAVWMIALTMWPEELEGHGVAINVVQSLAMTAQTATG